MRDAKIARFLAASNWDKANRAPLAGDASARRYERLNFGHRRAVLMDAPPAEDDSLVAFIRLTELLRNQGYSAPEIFARDTENGFLLLEDLGDDLFAQLCARDPDAEGPIYEAAVDLLADLHARPVPAGIPPYSTDVYLRESALLTDWYLGPASKTLREEFLGLVNDAVDLLSPSPKVLVLRDYHAENLLWLPDRSGHKRIGLLDYQDALIGHPAYDLVSLLEDARRDTSATLQEEMLAHYIAKTGQNNLDFRRDYAILGAQRNLKIVGIFARLAVRDGKRRYLDLIPRVWDHLQRDLSHPDLKSLACWVSDHVPVPDAETLAEIGARA